MTRKELDVLNDNALLTLPRSTTDALAIGYAATSQRSLEWAENKLVALNTIESRPEWIKGLVNHRSDIGHIGYCVALALNKRYDLPI